ncbi:MULTISPECIES: hypothetical protein [unclassified Pseudoalteromonas]|uniref:hypothetical protein n=1 Tax=unclassified Pseudoalteromonas TaxID=194690 RepID=UPI0025B3B7E8|nr:MULTISPECIES: hypothetical protein [unclassified Pseudoalteromonas]MDN3378423.1 hypothetical protein [Pseudoalteromonas sp. APC 3893]MDN3386343.1 hypothetical protein [Pseudoalteromonas sp. APC 4017]
MSENYRVIFAGLAQDIQAEDAQAKLAAKLKAPHSKIAAFFENKPLFVPCAKDKALKQAKLLASVGIKSKLQPLTQPQPNTQSDEASQQRDERIFNALDYITSSLIRIEEKLDDLEQRISATTEPPVEPESEEWQTDDLLLDEDLNTPIKKRSNTLLYSLIAMVLILLVVLGLSFAFPDLFSFLDS